MTDSVSTDKLYPAISTYVISDFFRAKEDIKRIVNEVWTIKHTCEMLCFWRGDMTGQKYGCSYIGIDEVPKLLVEFEQAVAGYDKCLAELKKSVPAADFESFTYCAVYIKSDRELINHYYEEIKKYFDLTHKHYEQYPAPKREKVSAINNLINLAAYMSLIYTMWNIIFK